VIRPNALLCPKPAGLYCPPGDFYVDPVRPVARAVITHGHGDHARAGHGLVLATTETLAIMAARYGEAFAGETRALAYGESVSRDGVEVSLAPAGHVLGSAQAVVRWRGLTMVVSGDYKRRRDPTCAPFEPVACEVFITEATFGLPVFRHPPDGGEIEKLLDSVRQFPERSHVVGAYALGKAQRVIALLREAGWDRPIHVHGALDTMNAVYARFGVDLGPLEAATTARPGTLAGAIVIAPPSAVATPWARRLADPVDAFASGWMRIRARARQRGVELPLVISDHADWDELTGTIAELGPAEVWITHGREEALGRWCELAGIPARALALVGYEDEED
jgi:putative mRNA 3-end processing factor